MKSTISFQDFENIDIRVGTIVEVRDFLKAKKSAYQLIINFGALGIKKSSAQITELYKKEDLLNKQILAVINFSPKQIANFMSECLVLGVVNGTEVILLKPEHRVNNGTQVL